MFWIGLASSARVIILLMQSTGRQLHSQHVRTLSSSHAVQLQHARRHIQRRIVVAFR